VHTAASYENPLSARSQLLNCICGRELARILEIVPRNKLTGFSSIRIPFLNFRVAFLKARHNLISWDALLDYGMHKYQASL
jgi:hypothetical protein